MLTVCCFVLLLFVPVTEKHMLKLIFFTQVLSVVARPINNMKTVRIKHLIELWGFQPSGIVCFTFITHSGNPTGLQQIDNQLH